jgi:hypothetical protein
MLQNTSLFGSSLLLKLSSQVGAISGAVSLQTTIGKNLNNHTHIYAELKICIENYWVVFYMQINH